MLDLLFAFHLWWTYYVAIDKNQLKKVAIYIYAKPPSFWSILPHFLWRSPSFLISEVDTYGRRKIIEEKIKVTIEIEWRW